MTTLDTTTRIIDLARPRVTGSTHITIAIDNRTGRPITVYALDRATRNGKACDCTCVVCGQPLSAGQGTTNRWYFSHVNKADCPASSESTLHLAAKAVLQRNRKLGLPRYDIGHGYGVMVAPHHHIKSNIRHTIAERPAFEFAQILTEQPYVAEVAVLDDRGTWTPHQAYRIVADAVGVTESGRMCLVELVNTHPLDGKKEQIVHALGIPTVEIHLDHLVEHEESPDLLDLVQGHLEGLERRYWVVPPIHPDKRAEIEQRLHQQNREEVERQVEAWRVAQR
ncbi:hypothetical protein [Burkholderia anthina]|uniref:hypothetical protein n=1 Tax=Burkholderia anthina TaxID=179879 RepID=UPI0037C04563